jgi:hypothetical protein
MVLKDWRRKYIRMTCFLPSYMNYSVLIHYQSGQKLGDGWGVIQDISMGGIRIETRTPFQPGQEVFMSFSISENFVFTNVRCAVKRVVKDGLYYLCGLEFVNVTDREHLKDALEYLASFCHD